MSATQKPEKLSLESFDPVQGNLAQLAQLLPNCITETRDAQDKIKYAVDWDLLRQTLSSDLVEGPQERYRLDWPGKRQSLVEANTRIDKTLRPAPDESVNFDTTENLYIEGDNLEALKLLQNTYMGKIKMIYIDPPYNTGKDFIYKDNFKTNQASHDEVSEMVDDEGNRLFQAERFIQNTESNGRYHSDWLSMMYPRLKIARDLLKEDGVIFISIDDNEVHNLRKLCDEVFGEGNFISNVIWQRAFSPKNDAKFLSDSHDHIVIYAKNSDHFSCGRLPRTAETDSRYTNQDNDPRGSWTSSDLTVKTYSTNFDYPIKTPSGRVVEPTNGRCWSVSKTKFDELVNDNRVWFGSSGENMPRLKRFLHEVQDGIVPTSLWMYQEVGHNQEGRQEVKALFDDKGYFDGPKPTRLLGRVFQVAKLSKEDVILDFFSGSATTAHAVMQLNADDQGKRKFIMVQIPEPTPESSEAHKDGYATIAEIGKERIRRAGQKIKAENQDKPGIANLDIGFRVLKVDSSNFKAVKQTAQAMTQQDLLNNANNINEGIKGLDLLFQVMLATPGLMLSAPIEEKQIQGATVYLVNETDLIACFDTTITEALAHDIAALQPLNVVFRDSDFAGDDTLINIHQIFKLKSPITKQVKVV